MNVRREGRLPDARPPDIACVQQTSDLLARQHQSVRAVLALTEDRT